MVDQTFSATGVDTESSRPGEVLVVDDTADSLDYMCELLRTEGYSVRAAPNGELALWTAQAKPPDLILLDIRMPGMDGYEVCRQLKADARTASVPIIFLSAQSDLEDRLEGFRAGGVDYIGKPFEAEEALQRVATQVRLTQMGRALEQERAMLAQRVSERTAELEHMAQALREQLAIHQQLEHELQLAAIAFEASLTSMLITNAQGRILAINPAFSSLTGYAYEDCLEKDARLLNSSRQDRASLAHIWDRLKTQGKWSGELWIRTRDGNELPCFCTVVAVLDATGSIYRFVAGLHDLSENRDAQTLIEFLTHYDPLTGLPNRILVQDRFAQMVAAANAGAIVAIIYIDVDRFRHINDFLGYDVGNEVLQKLAGKLKDLLPVNSSLFRESADGFVLIHPGDADLLSLHALIEAVGMQLNGEFHINEASLILSASLGVAIYPLDGQSLNELIVNASLTLDRAKEQGGGGVAFFSDAINQGRRARYDIAQRIRPALQRGEFSVYLQPQFDAGGSELVGAEALLRWHSPELGFVSPGTFIPVAEETGSIIELGDWVLNEVCRQIAAWHKAGLGYLKVAVNLSARQFHQQDICATVSQVLKRHGIPADTLELEITECIIIDNVQEAIQTMHRLKELGLTIALDDFGTGYSNLRYLKKFPIDYLKIDQSFVRDLIEDPDADSIVCSIISLAHTMRLSVIAEGVETEAQQAFLAGQGCDLLQGYLLGRPMPIDDFRLLLAKARRHP